MFTGDTKFYDAAKSIQVAVDSALSVEVERSGVVPGAIPWDDCSCGMLAVSIGRVYLSDEFPFERDVVVGNCDSAWEVSEIIVQVIRCAPQPGDTQIAPSQEAQDTAARLTAIDAAQTLNALAVWICAHKDVDVIDALILSVEPQGPEGGCVGSEFRVRVAYPRSWNG